MPYMIENMKDRLQIEVNGNLKIRVTELGTHHSLNRCVSYKRKKKNDKLKIKRLFLQYGKIEN